MVISFTEVYSRVMNDEMIFEFDFICITVSTFS